MRIFILGGTGSIGTAVVQELIARSHSVTALSRSETSCEKIRTLGASPFRGDLRAPSEWVNAALDCDAILQVAATFDDDMGDVDRRAIDALVRGSLGCTGRTRFLYTGGCWLYGETKDEIATESRAFAPLSAFSWMVNHADRLLNCNAFSTAIIHPAMVYHALGGVFERFLTAARENHPIEIWGSPDTRWPLIERTDLARAYCDLLVRPDLVGHFNAVAQTGVRVGDIAKAFGDRYENKHNPVILSTDDLVKTYGAWAKGPTLDQQMSATKLRLATGWEPLVKDYRAADVLAVQKAAQ